MPSDSVTTAAALKSATSMFEILFPVPSTSNVLFVNVKVSDAMLASCVSTYALIDCCVARCVALSEDMVSSSLIAVPDTPVSKTGDVKVLFVNDCDPVSVATVESIFNVNVWLPAVDVNPVPPAMVNDCEFRSTAPVPESPAKSKSSAVICVST